MTAACSRSTPARSPRPAAPTRPRRCCALPSRAQPPAARSRSRSRGSTSRRIDSTPSSRGSRACRRASRCSTARCWTPGSCSRRPTSGRATSGQPCRSCRSSCSARASRPKRRRPGTCSRRRPSARGTSTARAAFASSRRAGQRGRPSTRRAASRSSRRRMTRCRASDWRSCGPAWTSSNAPASRSTQRWSATRSSRAPGPSPASSSASRATPTPPSPPTARRSGSTRR